MFSSNRPSTEEAVAFIHTFTDTKAANYCEKCGLSLLTQARNEANRQAQNLNATLHKYIHYVPLLSQPQPEGWQATPLGLVTGQSRVPACFRSLPALGQTCSGRSPTPTTRK